MYVNGKSATGIYTAATLYRATPHRVTRHHVMLFNVPS
jgi:ketopantoate reductase